MNRLQKKCFLASTGFHLLLVVILLIGPAFVSSKSQTDTMPVLDFVPFKTVDSLISGGGNPNANSQPATFEKPQPAPPAPPAPIKPAPLPPPEQVREVDPPKDEVKEVSPPKDSGYSLEPAKDLKPKKPAIEFTPITRPTRDAKAEAKAKAEAQAREEEREYFRRETDRRRHLAATVGGAANSLAEGRSGSTSIELKGPGGGGVPYANFLQAVKSVYQRSWIVPDGITDDNGTVAVSVTIARDGTVVSSRITRSSGNVAVDRSVQVTLDRVKFAAPLPDDAKENQRTVGINFNVAAKRAQG
jgi:colicin import membrane protein